jgi:predicted dehydrogenase
MQTDKRTIRWGVITAGRITHTFSKDIAFCDNTEIFAVGARSIENAQAFADQYGIKHAFAGYDTIFNHPKIDAVYIASPHTLHFEQIEKAILAGKHVLCEKPIVTNIGDLKRAISLAKANNVFLMEAMWTYFLPAIQKAKAWVDGGAIGELLHVKADFGYPIPYSPELREYDANFAGGCLLEMGIYPIAFNWLFHPQMPDSASGRQWFAPNGVEHDVSWSLEYPNSSACLHTSFRSKLPNVAVLIGTKGTIQIPDFWRATECHLYELETPIDSFTDDRQGSGFEFQIQHTCDAIRNCKTESDVVSFADSLAFQEHIELARGF